MTIQTLLNYMMLGDNTLDLIAGGDEVTRGIRALNLVQKWLEAAAATFAEVFEADSPILTVANQEYTVHPGTLLRIDSVWMLDQTTLQPSYEISPIFKSGGQVASRGVWSLLTPTPGAPDEYRSTGPGGKFWWSPIPVSVMTIRVNGLWTVADYTAAANTFGYPDVLAGPMALYATKVMKAGLGRELEGIQAIATPAFVSAIKALGNFNRTEPRGLVYSEPHET